LDDLNDFGAGANPCSRIFGKVAPIYNEVIDLPLAGETMLLMRESISS